MKIRKYDSSEMVPGIIQEIREVATYRYLLSLMIRNKILNRYKRSLLGIIWTLINPLLMMLVISLAFSLLFGRKPGYPVYVLSGMILWNFFSQTTVMASSSLVWGGGLMKRIYFPRSTIVIANTGAGVVNLAISLLPLGLIMLVSGISFTPAMLFLPVSIILTTLFVLGISFFLAATAVFFSDVVDLYQALLRAAFYLTPVMYPVDILPIKLAELIIFNPLHCFITIFRVPIYDGVLPSLEIIALSFCYALISFLVGGIYFTKQANQIAYRI